MSDLQIQEATEEDLPSIAKLLSDPGTEEYWVKRVMGYYNCQLHPQKALLTRTIFIAVSNGKIVGMIAGHLTERFACEGELQWLNVDPQFRGKGIALQLLEFLAKWFIRQNAFYICVDVGSEEGRAFYKKTGAEALNEHWMVWKDIRRVFKNPQ